MFKECAHLAILIVAMSAVIPNNARTQPNEYKIPLRIEALIAAIKGEESPTNRFELASELRLQVVDASENGQIDLISDASIDEITGMLGDRATRLWAAATLKIFGSRACRALPALELALEDEQQAISQSESIFGPQVDALDVTRDAIQRIASERCD